MVGAPFYDAADSHGHVANAKVQMRTTIRQTTPKTRLNRTTSMAGTITATGRGMPLTRRSLTTRTRRTKWSGVMTKLGCLVQGAGGSRTRSARGWACRS